MTNVDILVIVLFKQEEDEECRIFAAAKTKMMKLRAEKERELHMCVVTSQIINLDPL